MKAFARATAGFLLALGILIILFELIVIFSSFLGNFSKEISNPGIFLALNGLTMFINIIVGGVIGVQGIFVMAVGQVLWLLTDISEGTEQTNQHLLAIFRQIYKPNSKTN